METLFGGSDGFWGLAGTVWSRIGIDDGGVWMIDEEAVAFSNDGAEEGNGL